VIIANYDFNKWGKCSKGKVVICIHAEFVHDVPTLMTDITDGLGTVGYIWVAA
jgi:hypothetical protein